LDDTFFQKNPFGTGMPVVKRLHLFEQHPSVDASKTSAGVLMKACVDIDLAEEMVEDDPDVDPRGILSAATALGSRDDIIDYLGLVYSVIREWMQRPECHFQHSSGDAGIAILNFLRVKERLPYRTRVMIHRTGIVDNVAFEGQNAIEAHVHLWKFRGLSTEEAERRPFEGAKGDGWIDTDYLVTDENGVFIDVFYQKSAIIFGYQSFGLPFLTWLDKHLDISTDAASSITTEGAVSIVDGAEKVIIVAEDGHSRATSSTNGTTSTVTVPDAELVAGEKENTLTVVAGEKEKEGYYLDGEENVDKNNTKPERKQKAMAAGEVPVEKKASEEDMYYPAPKKEAPSEKAIRDVNDEEQVVPVEETHAKIATESDGQEEKKTGEDVGEEEEYAAKNIPLERVDKKYQLPEEEADGQPGILGKQ